MKVGDKFSHTFEVDEQVYQGFQSTFLDMNPMHVDEAFAQDHGFAGKVMYGNILNGFVSYFVGEMLPFKNVVIYQQNMNFKKPVYLQDSISFEAELVDHFESVNTYEFKFTFKNEAGKKVGFGEVKIGRV